MNKKANQQCTKPLREEYLLYYFSAKPVISNPKGPEIQNEINIT